MKYNKQHYKFLHSPFRYNGQITYALGNIIRLIPIHNAFIEPFCGGAGIFFGKPKAEKNWLNDKDKELIETYKIIRDKPEAIIDFLKKYDTSKEDYDYINTKFSPGNSLETASRWFYLNRTSNFKIMPRFWERDETIELNRAELQKIIMDCSRKLHGVNLTSGDFEEVISSAPEGAFLFVAPPYSFNKSSDKISRYKIPFTKEDHFRLANILRKKSGKIKFLLTYRNIEEIKKLFSWGKNVIQPVEKDNIFLNDPTKKLEDQIKPDEKEEEIVITNYRL